LPTSGPGRLAASFPIANGGEEATLNAFIFLWLVAAGAGRVQPGRVDRTPATARARSDSVSPRWSRRHAALLRVILGFLITLHGIRKVFEVLPSVAGRRGAPPLRHRFAAPGDRVSRAGARARC
jgi:uncharacterized membrane protein YphA (DoxX/SURF4 family)